MDNVTILMQSRTGSSAVASAFRAHGWNTGGDKVRSRWYTTHENQDVKQRLVAVYGSNLDQPVNRTRLRMGVSPVGPDQKLRAILDSIEPWAWKGDAYYLDVFRATFLNLSVIYVIRDVEDAIESSLGPRSLTPEARTMHAGALRAHLHQKYDWMRDQQSKIGGVIVDATAVLNGDFDTLKNAITYAEGDWNEDLTKAVIRMNRPARTL